MISTKISTRGRVVIPKYYRQALRLQAGDKLDVSLEGEKLVLKRGNLSRARLVEKNGRKVLKAGAGSPPMTPELVKFLLSYNP